MEDDTTVYFRESHIAETDVEKKDHELKNVLTIDDILPEILLKIFGYLTTVELIAAQCVCRTWRTVAHDKYLWKNYTFFVNVSPEHERRLTVMPALQNIGGHANNNYINIILDHVTNLNKMNCKYKPPISFFQVESLVQKYPDIQSITLDVCAPDILQSVKVLQTSEKIKELFLQKQMSCIRKDEHICECSSLSDLTNILDIFADPRYFPTLIHLEVTGLNCDGAFKDPLFVSVYTRVLTNRSHQLQLLKLDIKSAVDVNFINALNMCSGIQDLQLRFYKKCPGIIDISRMAKLKILNICMWEDDRDLLGALYDCFSKNTWLYLTKCCLTFFVDHEYMTDILGALTKNARQLKYLSYYHTAKTINKYQLKHIGNLSKLENLSLSEIQNISEESMTYISRCYNLQDLYLAAQSTSIADQNRCIADMIHSLKQLNNLCFVVYGSKGIRLIGKYQMEQFTLLHGNKK